MESYVSLLFTYVMPQLTAISGTQALVGRLHVYSNLETPLGRT